MSPDEQMVERFNQASVALEASDVIGESRRLQRALIWVTEGEEPMGGWSMLAQFPVLHYDFTGSCLEDHPHAGWSPGSSDLQVAINAAFKLVGSLTQLFQPQVASDNPAGKPLMAQSAQSDFVPDFVPLPPNPNAFACIHVLAAVLWAAGCEGRGPRDAMGWLSAGQMKSIRDYCVKRAGTLGKSDIPLWGDLDATLASPNLPFAVSIAWQALAPFEEAVRLSSQRSGLQMLEIEGWVVTRGALVVTLPAETTALHRAIPYVLFPDYRRSDCRFVWQMSPTTRRVLERHLPVWVTQRPSVEGGSELMHWPFDGHMT